MNFQELLHKLNELNNPMEELVGGQHKLDVDHDGDIEGDDLADLRSKKQEVDECGMDMMPPSPSQSDSVSMNVNMNGSGAGGIRDLLDILKNLDGGSSEHGDAHSLGDLIDKMDSEPSMSRSKEPLIGSEMEIDEFANEPDEMYGAVGDVIPTGNDIHSHGSNEVEKVNGGGNPYTNVDEEALIARLASLYETIKGR